MRKKIYKFSRKTGLLVFCLLGTIHTGAQPKLSIYPPRVTISEFGQTIKLRVNGQKVQDYSIEGYNPIFTVKYLDNRHTVEITYNVSASQSSQVVADDEYDVTELYFYDRNDMNSMALICKYPISHIVKKGLEGGRIECGESLVETGNSPGILTSASPASHGNGTYNYQWQESIDGSVWNAISGATGTAYRCPSLSDTRYYRRSVKSGNVVAYSNTVKIEVVDMLNIPLNNENYILTRTMLNPSGTAYTDKIEYFDGLGRPVETVLRESSPSKQDIVTYQEYDGAGRQNKVWLPVPVAGAGEYSGSSSVQNAANSFYLDSKAYQETIHEASTLNRVLKQFGAGQAWQHMDRAVKSQYLTNTASGSLACMQFAVQADNTSIQNKGLYANGTLFVTQVTDEDKHISYEFKDKQEQVVLKRTVDGSQLHDTYFVYDDFGRLRYVLPPTAADFLTARNVSWNTANNQTIRDYAYYYQYDERGNCTLKKLPGCEPVKMVYDRADRMVFSQDGNAREKGCWAFSLYDALGRPTVTGMWKTATAPTVTDVVVRTEYTGTGALGGYTANLSLPASATLHTVNYYDSYDFVNLLPASEKSRMQIQTVSGYGTAFPSNAAPNARGLLTGTRIWQLGSTVQYTVSALYYDSRGRVAQSHTSNHLGGFEDEYFSYTFTGKVLNRRHVHSAAGKTTQTEVYGYAYDHAERLLTVTHRLNSNTPVVIVTNTYDEIGRLKSRQIPVETSVYTYNVRSWLTQITGSRFRETLAYNETIGDLTPSTPCYGGNISSMKWQTGSGQTEHGYRFAYDGAGRLTKALYGEGTAITANNKYNEIATYDKMGNITALHRQGKTDNGFGLIDKLTYSYSGNQLVKVSDASGAPMAYYGAFHFVDGVDMGKEYVYDANGNMTQDYNKKISKIEYNSVNLPSKLQFSYGHLAEYAYDATGRKLRVTYTTSKTNLLVPMGNIVPPQATNVATTLKTDYCGNMIYDNGKLARILIDGGYITLTGNAPVYHYYLQDHLGNNRVVVQDNGTVEQVNHYYPFGGLFGESTGGSTQPYKYNGKELDRMHGLDWYDYGARHYDAMLGRWMCMDPSAEKTFPVSGYTYCLNNPVNSVDPDGRFPFWAVLGAGIDYGFQVYDNYQSGKSGYDAWIGNVDFVSVGLSAVNPTGKFKVLKTVAVEIANAAIKYKPNDKLGIKNDIIEVATEAAWNTGIAIGAGKLMDAGSTRALQKANKGISNANQQLRKAEEKALRSPNSPKKAKEVSNARLNVQQARNKQVRTQMLNSTVGKAPNASQKVVDITTNRLLKDDEKEK
uniref:DUF6443 domain-containing protein n=1 Tax=Prevotella sp. GTC17254 TaxID=3236794 RepID=A0AB33J0G4_9BACT